MQDDGEIDDDEFLRLYEANRCRNLHIGHPYWKYDPFDSVAMKYLYEDLIENSRIVTQLLEKFMHNDIKLN